MKNHKSASSLTKSLRFESLEERQLLTAVNLAAVDDHFKLDSETGTAVLNVLANDDLGPYDRYTTIVAVGEHRRNDAQATIVKNGTALSYSAPGASYFRDNFTYTIEDRWGNQSVGTVSVQTGENRLFTDVEPTSSGQDSFQVLAETDDWISLDVSANDRYIYRYSYSKSIVQASKTSLGSQVVIDGGTFRYRPAPGAVGTDSFTYIISETRYGDRTKVGVTVELEAPYEITTSHHAQLDTGLSTQTIRPDLGQAKHDQLVPEPRIETVNIPAYAGTIEISADGQSLLYHAEDGFDGEFTGTYTVRYGDADYQTVEGSFSAAVRRRFQAIDDRFEVVGDTADNLLEPLANDLHFNYPLNRPTNTSPQNPLNLVIAYVYEGDQGGTMEIAADGQTLSYTPQPGFRGEEIFRYLYRDTFRGVRSSATMTITVTDPPSLSGQSIPVLPQLTGDAELRQLLMDRAVAKYDDKSGRTMAPSNTSYSSWSDLLVVTGYSGSETYDPRFELDVIGGNGFADDIDLDGVNGFGVTPPSVTTSQTNTQVANVDEADLVETDGQYLYTISDGKLVIVDVSEPSTPTLVSFTTLERHSQQMYLAGDRLTLVGNGGGFADVPSLLTVFDVSDRSKPTVVERTEIDGEIKESRAIGDRVYVVVDRDFALPELQSTPVTSDDSTNANPNLVRYETYAEYCARVGDTIVSDSLPGYRTYNAAGELVAEGQFNEAKDIFKMPGTWSESQTLAAFDISDETLGPIAATSLLGEASDFHFSETSAYLFQGIGSTTHIHKFDLSIDEQLPLVATGTVEGSLVSSFAADEYDGHLRMVAVKARQYASYWNRYTAYDNHFYVLEQDGQALNVVGELIDFITNREISAVRFQQDRAYVFAYRHEDPMLAIDLSDQTAPAISGTFETSDYFHYAHPLSENFFLGVGSSYSSPQVSLFHTGNLTTLSRADQWTFDSTISKLTSLVVDHHAFAYFPEDQIFTLPVSGEKRVEIDDDGDGIADSFEYQKHSYVWAFRVHTDESTGEGTLEVIGEIAHDGEKLRSVRVGRSLLTVSEKSLQIHNLDNLDEQLAELHLGHLTVNDVVTVQEDSTANIIQPLLNDRLDAGDPEVTITSITTPISLGLTNRSPGQYQHNHPLVLQPAWLIAGNATISADGKSIEFSPAENFHGTIFFAYTIEDEFRGRQSATIAIKVEGANDDPTAVDDAFTFEMNAGRTEFDVLANDSDPDSDSRIRFIWDDSLTDSFPADGVIAWEETNHGTNLFQPYENRASGTESGSSITEFSETSSGGTVSFYGYGNRLLRYEPPRGFTGIDTFQYTMADPSGLTSEATVTIQVGSLEPNGSGDPPPLDEQEVGDPFGQLSLMPAGDESLSQTYPEVTGIGTSPSATTSPAATASLAQAVRMDITAIEEASLVPQNELPMLVGPPLTQAAALAAEPVDQLMEEIAEHEGVLLPRIDPSLDEVLAEALV